MKFRIKNPHSQRRAGEPKSGRDCHRRTAHAAQKRSPQQNFVAGAHAEIELIGICFCVPRILSVAQVRENWFSGSPSMARRYRSEGRGEVQGQARPYKPPRQDEHSQGSPVSHLRYFCHLLVRCWHGPVWIQESCERQDGRGVPRNGHSTLAPRPRWCVPCPTFHVLRAAPHKLSGEKPQAGKNCPSSQRDPDSESGLTPRPSLR